MHKIENPYKILLPNIAYWNLWFKIVFYAKDHIEYWYSFFYEEYEKNKYHLSIFTINKILQDISKREIITVYINFIIYYAQEFV